MQFLIVHNDGRWPSCGLQKRISRFRGGRRNLTNNKTMYIYIYAFICYQYLPIVGRSTCTHYRCLMISVYIFFIRCTTVYTTLHSDYDPNQSTLWRPTLYPWFPLLYTRGCNIIMFRNLNVPFFFLLSRVCRHTWTQYFCRSSRQTLPIGGYLHLINHCRHHRCWTRYLHDVL